MTRLPHRTTYIWPRSLRLPGHPPQLVYLDLNHWISLAKAHSGHWEGARFGDALASCLDAVDRGTAAFPISDAIYMEVAKIGSHRQRRDLRRVIERLSGFLVITSRVVIAQHELEALLDRLVGPSPDPINAMDYLDWGVARAFGKAGGFTIVTEADGRDVTDDVRSRHPGGPAAFDRRLAWAELELNRRVLEGPTPDERPELLALGWNPRAAHEVSKRRAVQELEQVQRFNDHPSWRRGRVRDVIAAREVAIEINRMLWEGVATRGVDLEEVFTDVDATRRAFESMPSFDVSVSLKTAYHRNLAHRWRPNHVLDIDALASTVPYCDIVVTDKEAASHVVRAGLHVRLGTTVLSSLAELPKQL